MKGVVDNAILARINITIAMDDRNQSIPCASKAVRESDPLELCPRNGVGRYEQRLKRARSAREKKDVKIVDRRAAGRGAGRKKDGRRVVHSGGRPVSTSWKSHRGGGGD